MHEADCFPELKTCSILALTRELRTEQTAEASSSPQNSCELHCGSSKASPCRASLNWQTDPLLQVRCPEGRGAGAGPTQNSEPQGQGEGRSLGAAIVQIIKIVRTHDITKKSDVLCSKQGEKPAEKQWPNGRCSKLPG